MSPERTSHATSLPVRAERPARADAPAGDDAFATLLGAHANRPERPSARRDRAPADDRARPDRARPDGDRPERAGARAPRRPDAPATDEPAAGATTEDTVPGQPAAPTPLFPLALVAQAVASGQAAQPAAAAQAGAAAQVAAAQTAQPALPAQTAPPAASAPPAATTARAHPAAATAAASPQDATANPGDVATPPADAAGATTAPAETTTDRPAELPDLPAIPRPPAHDRPARGPADLTATQPSTSAPGDQGATRQGDGRPAGRQPATQGAPAVQAQPATQTASRDLPPVTAPAPAPAAAPATGTATLSQAPRAVAQVIHLATQSGIQRARLNLRPAELGGIEIRLQSTAAGVSAQLVADSPHAARLLQQASDDLRRSLASHDVQLLSLDVSTSGEDRRDASAASSGFGAFDDPAARGQTGPGRSSRRSQDTDPELLPTPAPGTVLELPDGVLVDVLA